MEESIRPAESSIIRKTFFSNQLEGIVSKVLKYVLLDVIKLRWLVFGRDYRLEATALSGHFWIGILRDNYAAGFLFPNVFTNGYMKALTVK